MTYEQKGRKNTINSSSLNSETVSSNSEKVDRFVKIKNCHDDNVGNDRDSVPKLKSSSYKSNQNRKSKKIKKTKSIDQDNPLTIAKPKGAEWNKITESKTETTGKAKKVNDQSAVARNSNEKKLLINRKKKKSIQAVQNESNELGITENDLTLRELKIKYEKDYSDENQKESESKKSRNKEKATSTWNFSVKMSTISFPIIHIKGESSTKLTDPISSLNNSKASRPKRLKKCPTVSKLSKNTSISKQTQTTKFGESVLLTSNKSVDSMESCDSEENEVVHDVYLDKYKSMVSIESAEISASKKRQDSGKKENHFWPLRLSLFEYIPPYIKFNSYNAKEPFKLPKERKFLIWKLNSHTPITVRLTVYNTGFRLIKETNRWVGTWGGYWKSAMFRELTDGQKLNHFPGTFELARKDRLWINLQRVIKLYGRKEFGFIPRTYILPQQLKKVEKYWDSCEGHNEKWIVKPAASARGIGIKVINKWSQIPKRADRILQKYISNPYLIDGKKFDLRLYVLITSFDPLRIYMYDDGLVRFATTQYNANCKDLNDNYMHLTNYSINKWSVKYTANNDVNSYEGHKWTILKLLEYLKEKHIDTKGLWRCLQQLVIKTIISAEHSVVHIGRENIYNRYNCYELLGIDVLLDEKLNPWLLEVNLCPSLHSETLLDAEVKGPMVRSMFDIVQFHIPESAANAGFPCYDPKLYTVHLKPVERDKHLRFMSINKREDYLEDILKHLTGDDIRHLTQAEDELQATGKFERIFPSNHTYRFLQYIRPRYYNRLFDAWENKYGGRRMEGIKLLQGLCKTKKHLDVILPIRRMKTDEAIQKESSTTHHSLGVQSSRFRPKSH